MAPGLFDANWTLSSYALRPAGARETMAERPRLPLETQAAIENARERAIKQLLGICSLLFIPDTLLPLSPIRQAVPKPANLKLELRRYSLMLFDAEAQHYGSHSANDEELRRWLEGLAECIQEETINELRPFSALHDYHCNADERAKTIAEALGERVTHWLRTGTQETEVSANAAKATADPSNVSDRLDEARLVADISHEEQAHRIGISRTAYFEVKAGRGGRKAKRKVELYLKNPPSIP